MQFSTGTRTTGTSTSLRRLKLRLIRSSSASPTREQGSIPTLFLTLWLRKTSCEAPAAASSSFEPSWMRYTFGSYTPGPNSPLSNTEHPRSRGLKEKTTHEHESTDAPSGRHHGF